MIANSSSCYHPHTQMPCMFLATLNGSTPAPDVLRVEGSGGRSVSPVTWCITHRGLASTFCGESFSCLPYEVCSVNF